VTVQREPNIDQDMPASCSSTSQLSGPSNTIFQHLLPHPFMCLINYGANHEVFAMTLMCRTQVNSELTGSHVGCPKQDTYCFSNWMLPSLREKVEIYLFVGVLIKCRSKLLDSLNFWA